MSDVTIRKAKASDIPAIQRLYKQLDRYHVQLVPEVFQDVDGDARTCELVERQLSHDQSAVLLAEVDGHVVGFVNLRIADAPAHPVFRRRQFVLIEDAVVDEQYRSRGLGTKLFEAAIVWARERGVRHVQTSVWSANAGAVQFYLSQGFQPILVRMELDTENQAI